MISCMLDLPVKSHPQPMRFKRSQVSSWDCQFPGKSSLMVWNNEDILRILAASLWSPFFCLLPMVAVLTYALAPRSSFLGGCSYLLLVVSDAGCSTFCFQVSTWAFSGISRQGRLSMPKSTSSRFSPDFLWLAEFQRRAGLGGSARTLGLTVWSELPGATGDKLHLSGLSKQVL